MTSSIETNARQIISLLGGLESVSSLSDVPGLVVAAMEHAENIKKMKGIEKKNLVIYIVQTIIDESDVFGAAEGIILPMVGPMIDRLVEADDGKLKINSNLKAHVKLVGSALYHIGKDIFKTCKCCKC